MKDTLADAKMMLQNEIWHGESGLEPTLDRAVEVVIEASKPEYEKDPYRPCVHEDLLLVYQMVDLPGYAEEIERVSSQFVREIDKGSQCHFCMATLHVTGLAGRRRHAEAEQMITRYIAELPRRNSFWHSRWLDLLVVRCDNAASGGDIALLRETVATLRAERPKVRGNNVLLAAISYCELRLACIDETDSARAGEYHAAIFTEVAPSADFALAGDVVYATHLAANKRWPALTKVVDRGIPAARGRQAYRWLAELLLLALEAEQSTGDRTARLAELRAVIPKLKSRDLDERARRLA